MKTKLGRRLFFVCGLLAQAAWAGSPIPEPSAIKAAWVVLGAGGEAMARVITTDKACPHLMLDGMRRAMQRRTAAETLPQRPTASAPGDSKPAAFPVTTCELPLPATTRHASLGKRQLPLPKTEVRRIVIIGDTGCRMKKSEDLWQDCSSPETWPFINNARIAASLKPDLVIHVGDYQYRENPCPAGVTGCRGSPWGYGWDVWQAEVFTPAAPLLAAAPWIMARGNHEDCARGGQGWFRFLDPQPYDAARSCNDAGNDAAANFSEPYAVPLGHDAQIIVFDSAKAGNTPLDLEKPADIATFAKYRLQFETVGKLAAKPGITSLFTNHHPILGLTPTSGTQVISGNPALLSAMKTLNATAYYPPGIQLALHGHTHLFEAIGFASDHPATLLSGNGGDHVDQPLPDPLPANTTPAEGVSIDRIAHSNSFGFLLMERQPAGWTVKAYRQDGSIMTTCRINQRQLDCDRNGLLR
jgi:hypothetical protein